MAAPTDPWRAFELDPRDASHASLRAADRDRDVIAGWLATAYAEGRLDREEHDERSQTLAATRTLGELPPIVADLVPARPPSRRRPEGLAVATPSDVERMALEKYRSDLRGRATTFVWLSLVTWAIWFAAGHDAGPWPLIVMVLFGLRVAKTVTDKQEIVRAEVRRLEKKQRRSLKAPETPMGDD
jgi:hypothetical protein